MKKLITLSIALLLCLSTFTQVFSDEFTGIDSIRTSHNDYPANIEVFYNDGDSVLYIGGGALSYVNGIPINHIFSWNSEEIRTYQSNNKIRGWLKTIIKYNDSIYGGGVCRLSGSFAK